MTRMMLTFENKTFAVERMRVKPPKNEPSATIGYELAKQSLGHKASGAT